MIFCRQIDAYKLMVSIAFGLLGFYVNFHTIIFPIGDYTVAVLFGLLFPLLVTLSWGWKYGLVSALAGGCQSMWWLWGPSNGYAVFLVVPPFTFWIVWHGFFADLRKKHEDRKWWQNMYILEIPFRIACSMSLLTLCRWAISLNPPPWDWAAASVNTISMDFSIFVAVKQASVAFVLLLLADVLLNIYFIRTFFKLEPVVDQRRTGYVVSLFLLIGCLFWLLDSFFHAFASKGGRTFIDYFALDIPPSNLFTRTVFLIGCMASGTVTARILRRQKLGEMALRKAREDAVTSEAFLKTLVRAIPDLVWLKNPEGVFLSCNSRFECLYGKKEAEIVGKTDYDFVDRELADFFRKHDKQAIERGKVCTNEEVVVFADGHKERLETTKTPMYNDEGELIGVLGISRDITERTNLQAQLAQALKMESVGRLAGGVAHDFNNMLSIIFGNAEFMLEDIPEDSPFVENLQEIQNAAQRSGSLTRQLLTFARKQTISPKRLDLNDAVEGIFKMLRRLIGEDIDLVWAPGKNLWPVKMDPSQVDQILANLCINARDAIPDVGKVIIETENEHIEDTDGVMDVLPGQYVVMTVSDTGCGMPEATLEHIFEPFYTTKDLGKGTGLGLATVYGIITQNNGFIDVSSEPGKGSVFKIYFPRHAEKSPDCVRPLSRAPRRPTGRETIVLVEDEPAVLKVTKRWIEQLGYTVRDFTIPQKAVEFCQSSEHIDLIVTDVVMPAMNGRDLYDTVAKFQPEIKCLFVSGYTRDIVAHHGILENGLNYISKPFSMDELAAKLREILDGKPVSA